MALRKGNRLQGTILPQFIESYVNEEDPVRAYDAFVDFLDMKELGIEIKEKEVGNSSYDPKSMLKLLVYGYSYGIRSSRKLERATHHNLSFIWLMGGLKPDHKTIARFRKNNLDALKNILRQSVKFCIKMDLIEGNTLFVDGSKFRGNASINQTKSKETLEKHLVHIEERINNILSECEKTDNLEQSSLVKMKEDLQSESKLKEKVKEALKEMEKSNKEKINLTDNECVTVKGRQGIHSGYNAQVVTDEKNGLIVHSDVIAESNDKNQFSDQINKANEILGENCKNACADAGYSYAEKLKDIKKEMFVVVPNHDQVNKKNESKEFSKDKFKYDSEQDIYICPAGQVLTNKYYEKKKKYFIYVTENSNICRTCKNYKKCTKNKNGRRILRSKYEEIRIELAEQYETDKAQSIYAKRKEKAELPFGHIKRNLNGGQFLLRGIKGVNAEMSLNCLCFNLVRMFTLLGGVRLFINELRSLNLKYA